MLVTFIVNNGIGSFYEFFRLMEKMRKREICQTLMILQILKKINDGFSQIDESIRLKTAAIDFPYIVIEAAESDILCQGEMLIGCVIGKWRKEATYGSKSDSYSGDLVDGRTRIAGRNPRRVLITDPQ
jgi:hypothetical protein